MELANFFTDLKFTKWLIFFSKFTKWIMDNDSSATNIGVAYLRVANHPIHQLDRQTDRKTDRKTERKKEIFFSLLIKTKDVQNVNWMSER